MSIGNGSIGEFSVGEQISSSGVDLPVSGAGTIAVVGNAPTLLVGTLIAVPTGTIAVVGNAPLVAGGKALSVPAAAISVVANAPQILQSANILIPVGNIVVVGQPPTLGAGAFVDSPSRQDSFQSFGESIGNHSIGEFSIGEGPQETTLSGRRTARIQLVGNAPKIMAGASIRIPVGTIAISGVIPEIDSRRRKLRSSAICS